MSITIKQEKQIGIGLFFFALLTIGLGACSDYYDLYLRKDDLPKSTPSF